MILESHITKSGARKCGGNLEQVLVPEIRNSAKKKDSGVVKEAGDILRLVKHTGQILESNNYLQDR